MKTQNFVVMKKPKKHCKVGSYEHTIPMPINGRRQGIDLCIADIVTALNAANILTLASCCGHGKMDGNIVLEDGRVLIIKTEVKKKPKITPTPILTDGKKAWAEEFEDKVVQTGNAKYLGTDFYGGISILSWLKKYFCCGDKVKIKARKGAILIERTIK